MLRVDAEPGELTGPEAPQPVIILADTRRFRVRAFVEEYDAPRLAVGLPARVTPMGCRAASSPAASPRSAPYEPQGTVERSPRRAVRHQNP